MPVRPPHICEFCWEGPFTAYLGLLDEQVRLATTERPKTEGYSYHATWAELQSRASGGCRWCQTVLATREDDNDSKTPDSLHIVVRIQGCLSGKSATPTGVQDLSVFVNDQLRFLGYVYASANDSAAEYIITRSRVLDVGSPRALALARECLEGCMRGHRRCVPPPVAPAALLPTRLIDCTDPRRPFLASTSGTRGSYVALSYVWGEAQPHSTTMVKLSAYAEQIDATSLPKTIRDAIHVTHALDIQYLWADTLCIIQDSDEDKAREIGKMRRIYRDAFLTVVACSAQKVSEGFLHDRPPAPPTAYGTFSRDFTLPFICPRPSSQVDANSPQRMGEIHVSPIWTYPDPPGQPLAQYDPACEAISTRGWCMQEYLMSPRALLFATHTLQFRCQTATQNVGHAFHDAHYERRLPDALFHADPPRCARGSPPWAEAREAWHAVVADYTRRRITVPSDKLVACGGIAEEFARVLRSEYLAGLWRDTLLADLLWRKRTGSQISRPAAYRAPSWSWAAVDGVVEAGALDIRPANGTAVAEVVSCEVALQHVALPYGEVTGALLVLRAPLIRCVWNIGEPNDLLRVNEEFVKDVQDRIGALDDDEEVGVEMEPFGRGYIDSKDDAHVRGAWAAPLHWSDNIMAGLVLASVDSPGAGDGVKRYRRIGMFDIHANSGPIGWVGELPLVSIEVI